MGFCGWRDALIEGMSEARVSSRDLKPEVEGRNGMQGRYVALRYWQYSTMLARAVLVHADCII